MSKIILSVKLILVIVLLVVCVSCPKFKRNPNLRLLLKEENYSLLNPRWTKSGWIYYIRCNYGGYGNYGPGEVWRIKDDGQSNELVFSKSIVIMDISPSETLLAAFTSEPYEMYSPLILYNVKTAEIETLVNSYYPNYAGLEFGIADTFVYYSDNNGVHRLNIYTKEDTIIIVDRVGYFDIYHDSLIYYYSFPCYTSRIMDISNGTITYESSSLIKGFFTQSKDTLLLVAEHKDGLQLYDIKTGEKVKLDAAIEEITVWAELGNCIDFDPSGKQIVFCATADVTESGDAGPFELWILEKF